MDYEAVGAARRSREAAAAQPERVPPILDRLFRRESGRRSRRWRARLGDLDRAEEAVQDAFASRSSAGRATACPDNPAAWIDDRARATGRSTGCGATAAGREAPSSSARASARRRGEAEP
jgi:predicted RNA polymerase sigma factor